MEGLSSHESIFVQIDIPLNENEENIAAIIKANIALRKSEFKYYENLKEKEEIKLNKLKTDLELIEEKIKKLEYIYLNKKNNKKEEKNQKDRSNKSNGQGMSKKIFEFPENKYIIQFNNERICKNGVKVTNMFTDDENWQNKVKKTKKENNIKKESEINKEKNKNNDININNKKIDIKKNSNESENQNFYNLNNVQYYEQTSQDNILNINNNERNYSSYNNEFINENNRNKVLIQENVLPVKSMSPIVNEVI